MPRIPASIDHMKNANKIELKKALAEVMKDLDLEKRRTHNLRIHVLRLIQAHMDEALISHSVGQQMMANVRDYNATGR